MSLPPLHEAFHKGLEQARDLWFPSSPDGCEVERVSARSLTKESFYRQYVARNRPVIITDAISHWPALDKWQDAAYFATLKPQEPKVAVNFTPDGWADALIDVADGEEDASTTKLFVKPHEVKGLPLSLAAGLIAGDRGAAAAASSLLAETDPDSACLLRQPNRYAAYLSSQNNNLTTEAPQLLKDVKPYHFNPFGSSEAAAVNLWLGTADSTSSCHKDHFDNLYSVIKGEKVFTLVPPCDVVWLAEREVATGTYRFKRGEKYDGKEEGNWTIDLDWKEGVEPSGCSVVGNSASLASPVVSRKGANESFSQIKSIIRPTTLSNDPWRWTFKRGADDLAFDSVAHQRLQRQPWISVDPSAPKGMLEKHFPLFAKHGHAFTATVKAGETLFLPAWWYHQVAQSSPSLSDPTLAVNTWFEADFLSPCWAYYNLCRSLAPHIEASGGFGMPK